MHGDSINHYGTPSGERRRFSRSVSADLEAIFRSKPELLARRNGSGTDSITSVQPKRQRQWGRAPSVLGVIAFALVGSTAAAFFLAGERMLSEASVVAHPSSKQTPAPTLMAAIEQKIVPLTPAPQPAIIPTEEPAPQVVERAPVSRAAPSRRSVAAAERNDPDCVGFTGRELSRCMRPQLLAADRVMRAAYAQATQTGLNYSTLFSYQQRWARVLQQADADPQQTTAALNRMAQELGDEQYRQRAGL
jgi:hypothetical protein